MMPLLAVVCLGLCICLLLLAETERSLTPASVCSVIGSVSNPYNDGTLAFAVNCSAQLGTVFTSRIYMDGSSNITLYRVRWEQVNTARCDELQQNDSGSSSVQQWTDNTNWAMCYGPRAFVFSVVGKVCGGLVMVGTAAWVSVMAWMYAKSRAK